MLRTGLIVAGLGLSLTLAGVTGASLVAAQETTTSVPVSQEVDLAEWDAERSARYEEFLARFTENLGLDDPAAVETAFKETLKEMVDERFDEGEISANFAEELKTRIDETDGPVLLGRFLHGPRDLLIGADRGHFRHGQLLPPGGGPRIIVVREAERPVGEADVEMADERDAPVSGPEEELTPTP